MTTKGFPPDQISTDIAVITLCACGREEHAIELIKELSTKNCPPDTYTYNFLVRHLVKNRSLGTTNCFREDMREFNIKPDLVTYTIIYDWDVYGKRCIGSIGFVGEDGNEGMNGRVAYAYEVFGYAAESKSLTDVTAYTTLENTLKWLRKAR
ncbi:unnamed protein product [Fraxinus pennsylvanica]|uniref:Pentatricopeptide repeat-containing protein n=1 Tax=Fraxinus pennsylvanica TaxID=56036 RepID=A0AAD1ZYG7_9LAMI|nr:unnamed protein product [Fraxinus pennsylvanica]